MVQVDVFWSYGLASGLALASRRGIVREPRVFESRYFVATLLWIALFFAPSGIYLLWGFPAWETMFLARDHSDIPAWLATLFAATNVSQGALGFWVTARILRSGRARAAVFQAIWSHAAVVFILLFGWDGSGFRRFTYAGTGEDWARGTEYPWVAFFSSPVFHSLIALALALVPTYAWLAQRLAAAGRRAADPAVATLVLPSDPR
jgi:hypothetical protein